MLGRLLVGGVASVTALLMFAVALQWSGRSQPALVPRSPVTALARSLTQPKGGDSTESWQVTRATAAHSVMVVDVEAIRPDEAVAIAALIVERARKSDYDEVLVYVKKAGAGEALAERRVQWTPSGGFVETLLSEGQAK